MKIKLPWKKKSNDGKRYRAKLTIKYDTTFVEELLSGKLKGSDK